MTWSKLTRRFATASQGASSSSHGMIVPVASLGTSRLLSALVTEIRPRVVMLSIDPLYLTLNLRRAYADVESSDSWPSPWVRREDVARFCIACLNLDEARNRSIDLTAQPPAQPPPLGAEGGAASGLNGDSTNGAVAFEPAATAVQVMHGTRFSASFSVF